MLSPRQPLLVLQTNPLGVKADRPQLGSTRMGAQQPQPNGIIKPLCLSPTLAQWHGRLTRQCNPYLRHTDGGGSMQIVQVVWGNSKQFWPPTGTRQHELEAAEQENRRDGIWIEWLDR